MDKNDFKITLNTCLSEFGFYKFKTWYCLDYPELFICLKAIKSYYSETFYLDYGIFLKNCQNDKKYKTLSPHEAQIRSRVGYCEYENIDENTYKNILKRQLEDEFGNLKTGGEAALRKKIRNNPSDFVLIMPIEERRKWNPRW